MKKKPIVVYKKRPKIEVVFDPEVKIEVLPTGYARGWQTPLTAKPHPKGKI